MNEEFNYLGERVNKKIRRYKTKIFFLNFFYYLLFIIQIAAAASLPLIATLTESDLKNMIISSCGIGILICQLIFNAANFKEKIKTNREILTSVETEKFLYLNQSGKYAKVDDEDSIDLFVGEIEKTFNGNLGKKNRPKRKKDIEFA